MEIPLIIPGILPLAIGGALWARWLYKRREVPVYVAVLPVVLMIIPAASLAVTVVGLIRAHQATAWVDASEKQRVLAEGIAMAMNATAAAYVATIVLLMLLAWVTFTYRAPRRD